MAAWCLVTSQSPQTYKSLSRVERDVFLDLAQRRR